MTHSIGKTIAMMRKTKGWTQVALAEKLGVSDKAVSKWESEGGLPDLSQLPVLAQIFDVSIDYIMTGKKEENISLDDMDDRKRMLYLIERDDAENYIKYRYPTTASNMRHLEEIIKLIFKHRSFKIFNICAQGIARTVETKYENYFHRSAFVDELIRFACLAGSIDFLERLGLKSFAVGRNYTEIREVPVNNRAVRSYETHTANIINSETIEFIFNNKEVPVSIVEYMGAYLPYDPQKVGYETAWYGPSRNQIDGLFYFLDHAIIEELYRSGRYELLEKYLQDALDDTLKTIERYENTKKDYGTFSTTTSSYLIHKRDDLYNPIQVLGKLVVVDKKVIELAVSNLDVKRVSLLVKHNRTIAEKLSINGFEPYLPSEKELETLFASAKREKRIVEIQNDTSISEHERRCRLIGENALTWQETAVSDDYDAFILLGEEERNKIDLEILSKANVQDIRFYIYAVNVNNDVEKLNCALKTILENLHERYDIIDVLLSAGAILDENIAITNILKISMLALNKPIDSTNIELNENATKQQLLEKIEAGDLEYVIVNATIQLEKKLKAHITDQDLDLTEMIEKALALKLISEKSSMLLHKMRMARNTIIHGGNKHHYVAEIVKMWVDAVYSIK